MFSGFERVMNFDVRYEQGVGEGSKYDTEIEVWTTSEMIYLVLHLLYREIIFAPNFYINAIQNLVF